MMRPIFSYFPSDLHEPARLKLERNQTTFGFSLRPTPEGTVIRHMPMDQSEDVLGDVSELPRSIGSAWLLCSCCRTLINDTPEENVCFGIQPYPHDDGVGECRKCFGNPAAKEFREQLGWAGRTFYDSRIEIVRGCLSPQKQKKFDELSYERKVIFIGRALERGLII